MNGPEGGPWLLGVFLACCGGRAAGPVPVGEGEAGRRAGGAEAMQNDAGAAGSSISPPVIENGGAGGEGPAKLEPLIGSATRYCESDSECFGQACVSPPAQPNVCAIPCETDADCWRDEVCVEAANGSHCYSRCDSPEDCAYAFDCFRFDDQVGLICFPSPWTVGSR